MTAPKVGDVVAWADVPDGALVRDGEGDFAVRRNRRGAWVFVSRDDEGWDVPPREPQRWWWGHSVTGPMTIVALGLTGDETAAELRRLAEVFEVREVVAKQWGEDLADELAERLHAAGWRPGMTAEDAARMLTGAGK